MSTHRVKRPFAGPASDPAQRHITSFFTTSSSSSQHNSITSSIASNSSSSQPLLPSSVQSNLISVGMRVRKSVPEGYKTGTYSSFGIWDENNNTNPHSFTSEKPIIPMGMGMGEGRSRANAFSSPRELLPFCGLHKVGGLDAQPDHLTGTPCLASPSLASNPFPSANSSYLSFLSSYNGNNDNNAIDNMDDDVPGLTSSQDTVFSSGDQPPPQSGTTRSRKRFYAEEEDTDGQEHSRGFTFKNNIEGEISPRSLTPVGWGNNGRIIAVPKGRSRRTVGKLAMGVDEGASFDFGHTSVPNAHHQEQENFMVVDSDFEDAEFLDNKAWDMEMSDI